MNSVYVGGGELEGWLWRYWWMKQLIADAWRHAGWSYAAYVALVSGSYPETGNVFDLQFFSMPLESVLGAPLYYNVKVLLFLVGNGLAAYALGRALVRDWSAAVLGGLAFGFGSMILREIDGGHIRQAAIFPLALYALCLVRMREPQSLLRWAVGAGLTFGLCTTTYLYYGMSAAFLTLLWLASLASWWGALWLGSLLWAMALGAPGSFVATLFGGGLLALLVYLYRRDGYPRIRSLAVLAVIATLSSTPCATWYLEQAWSGQPLREVTWNRPFPPLDLLLHPQNVHATDDDLLNSLQRLRGDSVGWDFPFLVGSRRTVPWIWTVLAGGGLLLWRRRPWLWLGVLLLGYGLSLGPYLRSGAEEGYLEPAVVTPYAWFFKYVPYFSRLFSPLRMQGLFLLGLGILVAWSAARLFERLRWQSPARVGFLCLCAAAAAAQMQAVGQVPLSVTEARVPALYQWLAQQPGDGVVEVPYREGDYVNYYQTVHRKRLLGGWAGGGVPNYYPQCGTRWLAESEQGLASNPFLHYLRALNQGPDGATPPFSAANLQDIADHGYRWLLLHERGCYLIKGDNGRAQYLFMRRILDALLGAPLQVSQEYARDGQYELVVYALHERPPVGILGGPNSR